MKASGRRTGVLVEWNDERGFGFVEAGGRRTFVHVSAFDVAGGRPQAGDFVSFERGAGADGRPCAVRAQRVYALPPRQGTRRARRGKVDGVAFAPLLALAVFLVLAIAYLDASPWYAVAYVVMSGLTFVMYAFDKQAAVAGGWRTRERTLNLAALLGGWPGAVVAQQALRHKNRKESFQLQFWLAALLNVLVVIGLTAGDRLSAALLGGQS